MDVSELAEALKEKGAAQSAKLMQRVQDLMGQGTDVSSLFPSIVTFASTRDVPVKKIAYSFLAKYGRTNEELCFLGINTLHQDCTDPDPIVRSLALKTLCSLGQQSVLRFMLQPLNSGLQDKNAHVRKTAVMACISVLELDPTFVLESEIVDKLYFLIRDQNTQVVVSALLALETILEEEGGVVINHSIAAHLISRFKDWTPSQLEVILQFLCRLKPQVDDEVYEMMNDVDDGVQHKSLSAQMATLKLFICWCQDLEEIQDEVRKTIEDTLLKHLESPEPDIVLASLYHLALLVQDGGILQTKDMEGLPLILCRPHDPKSIKIQKIDLCALIGRSSSSTIRSGILDHLSQVAGFKDILSTQMRRKARLEWRNLEAHVEIACRAIDAIATIGLCGPNSKPQEKASKEERQKDCMGRLFHLLVIYSGMEALWTAQSTRSKGKNVEDWVKVDLSDLNLEGDQTTRLISSVLRAIKECWQQSYDSRYLSSEINAGILDPFQTRAMGLLLLRHLDQGELDRLSKRNKPLRFNYDDNDERVTLPTSLDTFESNGGLSGLARIGGIRILLLEESIRQRALKHQSSNNDSEDAARTLEMRDQYTLLLQQQVQDLVQSLDVYKSTSHRDRSEQLATLHLACHLVAFSLEHGPDMAESPDPVLAHRLSILSQAITLLHIPAHLSEGHVGASDERSGGISRDVQERAEMLNSLFLQPLLRSLPNPDPLELNRTMHSSRFDFSHIQSANSAKIVRKTFISLFGSALSKPTTGDLDRILDSHTNISRIEDRDWQNERGFNTLAVLTR